MKRGEVKKRMKIALTRKIIVLTLAALMLTVGVVSAAVSYGIFTKPSNTITATQAVATPAKLVVSWVESPPASGVVTGQQFMMIVGVSNPNLGALEGLTFNVTVTGTGLIDPTTLNTLISVSMSENDLSTSYNSYYPMSAAYTNTATKLVFLGTYYSVEFQPGVTMWGFVVTSYTSASALHWSVAVVPILT